MKITTFLFSVLIPVLASVPAFAKDVQLGSQVIRTGYLQAILAKELCTCRFVTGLTMKQCLGRSNLPMPGWQLRTLLFINETREREVHVFPTPAGVALGLLHIESRTARDFGPQEGCRLVSDD